VATAYLTDAICCQHEMGASHPESPVRINAIEQGLKRAHLYEKLAHYAPPVVAEEQLLRVHTASYLAKLQQITPKDSYIFLDPDTAMNPYTYQAALTAAGSVVMAADLVAAGVVNNAFCNIRPPGHHAEHDRGLGFCIVNNIAVGVAHALATHCLDRIAIIDFDVHHGNGTEDIFKNDKRVLFCSSFQHPFYPFSGADTESDHIKNVPLPAGTGSAQFRAAIEKNWSPAIAQFKPQMIFVSAGFDAHQDDPLAQLNLVAADYAWIATLISAWANHYCSGKIVSALEGGYHLTALSNSAVAYIDKLLTP